MRNGTARRSWTTQKERGQKREREKHEIEEIRERERGIGRERDKLREKRLKERN